MTSIRKIGLAVASVSFLLAHCCAVSAYDGPANASAQTSPVSATASAAASGTQYSTNFSLTENPISEGGRWINGAAAGLDWANIQTTGGFAGGVGPASAAFSDPTAIVSGTWGPNQTVTATVHSVGASDDYYQEVELRLRTNISAHRITGYEVMFRTPNNGSAYVQIARWNGPVGSFTYVAKADRVGVSNGDVVKATIVGSTISAYINGTLIVRGTDATYATGNPGIGFDYGCGDTYPAFGFTSFAATDESTAGTTPPSTPTNLIAFVVSSQWKSFLLTVAAAGLAASFTDWLFMGVLFHEKYKASPEIWRKPPGSTEPALILLSTALGLITSAVFAALCGWFGVHRYAATLKLALALWAAGPLPIVATNALWMKFHPATAFSHALGWLARLCVTAVAVTLLLK